MVKRYDADIDCAGLFWECDDGEFVCYEDHEREVKELQSRLESLESVSGNQMKLILAMASDLLAATEKVESLEKDAARYRWLRSKEPNVWKAKGWTTWRVDEYIMEERDKAIDTAMKG